MNTRITGMEVAKQFIVATRIATRMDRTEREFN